MLNTWLFSDFCTDVPWCYMVFWVIPARGASQAIEWSHLKTRLTSISPSPFPPIFVTPVPEIERTKICLLQTWSENRLGLLNGTHFLISMSLLMFLYYRKPCDMYKHMWIFLPSYVIYDMCFLGVLLIDMVSFDMNRHDTGSLGSWARHREVQCINNSWWKCCQYILLRWLEVWHHFFCVIR